MATQKLTLSQRSKARTALARQRRLPESSVSDSMLEDAFSAGLLADVVDLSSGYDSGYSSSCSPDSSSSSYDSGSCDSGS